MADTFRALCAELVEALHAHTSLYEGHECDLVTRARAALAQPEPQGPSDQELLRCMIKATESVQGGQSTGIIDWEAEALAAARAAIAHFGRPAIEPVPVSERLPGPEDCDAEGRCWWFSPPACGPHTIRPCWTFDSETLEGDTHWLPHWALPVPKREAEQ
jgi:hypothetical protein